MIIMSMLDLSDIEGCIKQKEFKPIYNCDFTPEKWHIPENKIQEVFDTYNKAVKNASESIQNLLVEIKLLNEMVKGRDKTINDLSNCRDSKDFTYTETFINKNRGYKSDD